MKLMKVLSPLLLGMLAACDGKLGMNGLTPREYTAPLVFKTYDLDARFVFTRTPDESNQMCHSLGKRLPPPGSYNTGCAAEPNTKFNPTARWIIVSVYPTGWNDFPSLANIGHEVGHGLGATHE